jgi:hypothetical protein
MKREHGQPPVELGQFLYNEFCRYSVEPSSSPSHLNRIRQVAARLDHMAATSLTILYLPASTLNTTP